jgi:hypothetical protein
MPVDDDETLRQRQRRDLVADRWETLGRCRFCSHSWHGLPKHFPNGTTCEGSHDESKGMRTT